MLRKIFFNKQFEIRVTLLVMFVFVGCGTMFDGKEKSPNNIRIPKEVSMEIPKILKENKLLNEFVPSLIESHKRIWLQGIELHL